MEEKIAILRKFGCDVDGALNRMLDDEELFLDCVCQVLSDPAFDILETQVKEGNAPKAFEAAHSLKGIAGNTGITPLFDAIGVIFEKLRAGNLEGTDLDCAKIIETKNELINIIG
ncbi:MAG: Hpt domain-containing protein [Anaerovoracaceae bacterium]